MQTTTTQKCIIKPTYMIAIHKQTLLVVRNSPPTLEFYRKSLCKVGRNFKDFGLHSLKSYMNVMASGQWEVVGKQKKGKAPAPALTKSQKKTFIDRMPRIEKRGLFVKCCDCLFLGGAVWYVFTVSRHHLTLLTENKSKNCVCRFLLSNNKLFRFVFRCILHKVFPSPLRDVQF
jgi:hypothetical protein